MENRGSSLVAVPRCPAQLKGSSYTNSPSQPGCRPGKCVRCCTRAKESQAPAAWGTLPLELRALTWTGAGGVIKAPLAAPWSHQHRCFVPLQADMAQAWLWHCRWAHTRVGGRNSHSPCPTHIEAVQLCSLLLFHPTSPAPAHTAPFHITGHIHHPRCCQSVSWTKKAVLGSHAHRARVVSDPTNSPL